MSEINKEFMDKINRDLSNFGIKCECSNLYEYLLSNQRISLNLTQIEMPVISKNAAEFYKKLNSLDKFDVHEGVQKTYQANSANSSYYLKIGRMEEEIFEVEKNYKNTQ